MAAISLTRLLFERLLPAQGECEFSLASVADARSRLKYLPPKLPVEPVIRDRGGGVFFRWNLRDASPICYLGSEGEAYVAADNDRGLASLVAYGAGLISCMQYWSHELVPDSPRAADPAALKANAQLSPAAIDTAVAKPKTPHEQYLPTLLSAMRGLSIVLEPSPFERIEQANRAYLPRWLELCGAIETRTKKPRAKSTKTK